MEKLEPANRLRIPSPFRVPPPPPPTAKRDALAAELDSEERVAEVVVRWGEGEILEVRHLRAGETFRVAGGDAVVRALAERAEIDVRRGVTLTRAGVALGEGLHAIDEGQSASFEVAGLRYLVRSVHGARRIAAKTPIDKRPFAYVGGAALFHLVLFGVFALQPPRAGALSTDVIDTSSRLVAHYVAAQETIPEETRDASGRDGGQVGMGAMGETGAAGTTRAPHTRRRLAIPGSADRRDQRLGRLAQGDVRQTGILGVLAGMQAMAGPSSPYASATAIGSDAMAALGAMLGATPGDSFGWNGLGPAGTGSGGGDRSADTIGVGRYRTVGSARDYGTGVVGCIGAMCRRAARVPSGVELGHPEPRGALAAEVIRRVVSRHRAEIRFCYEQALQSRPDLEGRVVARFVISPTGAVTSSMASGSLGHPGVEQCVAQAVRRWSFPAPEDGGVVTVSYPFLFTAGG